MRSMFGDIRVRRSIQNCLLMFILLVTLLAGSMPAVQAQSADLFGAATTANVVPGADTAPAVRARYVSANLGLLLDEKGQARDVSTVPEVRLNLFPDASYTGLVTKVTDYGGDTHAWSGVLKDVTGGYFYLVTTGRTLLAHVASTRGIYEVSNVGDGVYRVIQVDQSKFVDEPNGGRDMPVGAPPAAVTDLRAADTADQIDVMVVYTGAALTREGSLAALKARIALAIVETNQGYANAGITTRLRLVHIQKVVYQQSGNIQKDVNRLASPIDGYMDNVHALRNQYGADMVSLIVDYGPSYPYCGIAKAILASAKTAFDVVARNCMTGYYSFGHEFGHLQGAQHDLFADPRILSPFPYAHGFVNIGATEPDSWRTIMAYNDACDAVNFYCTRLQSWSNSGVTYNGLPMGDTYAQNWAVLNATAATVANFKQQKIGADFASDFVADSIGWTPAWGTWYLSGGSYLGTTGTVNRFSTVKHDGKYGDLVFQATMLRNGSCTGCANNLIIRGKPTSLSPYKEWLPSYMFEYTNNGYYSVWLTQSTGYSIPLKYWKRTSAILNGDWNTLTVYAVGSSLQFYINGVLVWSGKDATALTGQVGIGMYQARGTTGELLIDSAYLASAPTADFAPTAGLTPSMDLQGVDVPGGTIYMAP